MEDRVKELEDKVKKLEQEIKDWNLFFIDLVFKLHESSHLPVHPDGWQDILKDKNERIKNLINSGAKVDK